MHNTSAIHGGPTFLNLVDSALCAVSSVAGCTVSTRNHPLPFTAVEARYALSRQSFAVVQVLLIATAFVPAGFVTFVVKEREVGAKHQQLVSGVGVLAYWTANYLFDTLTYLLPWALSVGIVFGVGVGSLTQREQDYAAALVVTLLAFGPASCAFCYLASHLFASHSTAQVVIIMSMILSFGAAIVTFVLAQVTSTCTLVPILSGVFRLFPMYALSNALQQLANMDILPLQQFQCDSANGGARDASFYAPFQTAFHPSVVGGGLSYLIVESIVYLALAVGFDFALRNPRLRRIIDREPPPLTEAELAAAAAPADEDDDVKAERLRISKLIESGANVKDDVVLLNRLRKVYRGGKQAVRALSFGLPAGEVFGFLGINGAGKTSALKMLSGDIMPSSGAAQLAGLDIITQQLQVWRLLGCELRTTRVLQPSSVPNLHAFCPFHSSVTIRLPAV
jgi:ATP-binding cassette subfamily A (ABC1) protein 1